ncbi:unnamed protein product [Brugia pahangi]|uniref:Uncharacterized protein n=1 Tax=Brugia pahangi TaxID=6280 RepID=A0A0N4TX35_BRUPA|nr:unnamed protein product [Brugia pahangi]
MKFTEFGIVLALVKVLQSLFLLLFLKYFKVFLSLFLKSTLNFFFLHFTESSFNYFALPTVIRFIFFFP